MADKTIEAPKQLRSLEDANAWAEYILVATSTGQISNSQAFAMQRMLGGAIKLNIDLPIKVAQLTAKFASKGTKMKKGGGWSTDMIPQLTEGKD